MLSKAISVKYFGDDVPRLKEIVQGDWIDIAIPDSVDLKAGEIQAVPYGTWVDLTQPHFVDGVEHRIEPREPSVKDFGSQLQLPVMPSRDRMATYRELSRWLAQGSGEGRWGDTGWHEPTIGYLGLDGGSHG